MLRFFPDNAEKKWGAKGKQHSLHRNFGPGSRAGDGVDSVVGHAAMPDRGYINDLLFSHDCELQQVVFNFLIRY